MKTNIWKYALSLLVVLPLVGMAQPRIIKGNGDLVTRTIALEDYHTIIAEQSVAVILEDTDSQVMQIEGDENAIDYLEVTNQEGVMTLRFKSDIRVIYNVHMSVRIPLKTGIKRLEVGSSAMIQGLAPIETAHLNLKAHSSGEIQVAARFDKCEVEAGSSAELKLALEGKECQVKGHSGSEIDLMFHNIAKAEVKASSSAEIKVKGTCEDLKLEANTSGEIDAHEVNCQTADAQAGSSGEIQIKYQQSLKASASTSGEIRYLAPKLPLNSAVTNATTGGSIERLN